ncbi:DJ-1/PfpI family protein [Cupriavidus lacunae]|uniref:DJ-1/PfpI domain-containing protein n=1 Tax=Cupriavidus lacunae TaxID=2666307 RepID=A0A370NNT6_9BURK|nr:DJ-1/PfpI family protein [Cupriavidus lacunae]RDK07254.1 hypothetical protein DN412_27125 [Cupriavidus lacunae]
MREAGAWLRDQHAHGALIGGSCAGVFVLGEAGLLNDRRCTTTWWLHEELKHRFPGADVVWGSALLEDDRVISAGGRPLSWIDLALHMISRLAGPQAARIAADFAVVDNTPLQQSLYAPKG